MPRPLTSLGWKKHVSSFFQGAWQIWILVLYAHGREGKHNTDAEASCENKNKKMSFTHGFIDDDLLFLAIYKKIAGELPRLNYWNVMRRGIQREGEDGTQTGKGLTAVRCGLSAYTLHIRKQKTSLSNLPNLKQ